METDNDMAKPVAHRELLARIKSASPGPVGAGDGGNGRRPGGWVHTDLE